MTEHHPEVRYYLRRLDELLAHLPRERRLEIVGEIEAHITMAVAELGHEPADHEIAELLERIGDPETVAAEEEPKPVRARKGRGLEIVALIFLAIGAFIIPFLGWFVGVALLWGSPVWTKRDKLIGTLVVPGGLAFPFYMFLFGGATTQTCSTGPGTIIEFDSDGTRSERFVGGQSICESSGIPRPVMTLLLVVALIAAVTSIAYLARRMRDPNVTA